MPSLRERARAHASFRRRLALTTAVEAARMWRRVEPTRIQDSWLSSLARMLVLLTGAQQAVAGRADTYLDEILDAQSLDPTREGTVATASLAGVASDGRDLTSLLNQPVITTLTGIQRGATVDRALASGQAHLEMIVRTQVADAGRAADQVAMTARPEAQGWVRLLTPPSCSRCAILAGKFYRWNDGFERHPVDDCIHVPASEDAADDLRTDPQAYFDSLTPEEQDRIFTKTGAEAIRLGSDLSQVVNARRGARGMATASRLTGAEVKILRGGRDRGRLQPVNAFGQDLLVTTEGTTTRGVAGRRLGAREDGVKKAGGRYRSAKAPRLMPEQILQLADGDRDESIRLLKRNGFIL